MRGVDATVVKLGGSYAFSRALKNWIDAVAACAGRVVLAPGGGPFAETLRAAGVPVWSATAMVRAAEDVPCSWEVTSDSLAVWLAGKIGAPRVLLVKHVAPPAGPLRAADLVADGVVDPAFPRFLRASGAQA